MKSITTPVTLTVLPVDGRARGQLATPIDGRYGAMNPAELQKAIASLTQLVDLSGVQHALGIPEGGYLPAYAFAVETGLRLVLASIFKPSGAGIVSFVEEHDQPALATKHVYGLAAGDHVLVVEDEVTTGRTLINCVRALRAAGIRCDQAAAVYAADDSAMRARVAAEGICLHAALLCHADTNERLYRQ